VTIVTRTDVKITLRIDPQRAALCSIGMANHTTRFAEESLAMVRIPFGFEKRFHLRNKLVRAPILHKKARGYRRSRGLFRRVVQDRLQRNLFRGRQRLHGIFSDVSNELPKVPRLVEILA